METLLFLQSLTVLHSSFKCGKVQKNGFSLFPIKHFFIVDNVFLSDNREKGI